MSNPHAAAITALINLGANIRATRVLLGLSQREAAKQAGVFNSTWNRVEQGENFYGETAIQLLRWLSANWEEPPVE